MKPSSTFLDQAVEGIVGVGVVEDGDALEGPAKPRTDGEQEGVVGNDHGTSRVDLLPVGIEPIDRVVRPCGPGPASIVFSEYFRTPHRANGSATQRPVAERPVGSNHRDPDEAAQ